MVTPICIFSLLCSVVVVHGQVSSQEEICQDGGKESRCVLMIECPQRQEKDLRSCGYDEMNAANRVCCPLSDMKQNITTYISKSEAECVQSINKLTPSGRVAHKKCHDYAKAVFFKGYYNKNSHNEPSCQFSCDNIDTYPSDPSLFGVEKEAKLKQFPYMVLIGTEDKPERKTYTCAGILISEKFVLTNAVCIQNKDKRVWVRLADHNILIEDNVPKPVEIAVKKITKHPHYKQYGINDLSLLELEKPVEFSPYVMPACLKVTKDNETEGIAAGWGLQVEKKNLKFVEVNLMSHEMCAKNAKAKFINISSIHICAENSGSLFDGSTPVQTLQRNHYCMNELIGSASLKITKSDSTDSYIVVFTKIAEYLPWIVGMVWPNELNEELNNF